MKSFSIFTLLAATLFFSCKKTTSTTTVTPTPVNTELADGFSSTPESISGYLYAGYTNYGSNSTYFNGFCVFKEPDGDLMKNFNHVLEQQSFSNTDIQGNIQVGRLSLNGNFFFKNNNGFSSINYNYSNSGSNIFNSTANWRTDGNGSFNALDITIPKGFPKIITQNGSGTITYTASQNNPFTIDFSNQISNFDSLVVVLGNPGSSGSLGNIQKRFGRGATSVTFTWAEFTSVSGFSNIQFLAFNYSHKTVASKIYVFELANRFSTYVYVN